MINLYYIFLIFVLQSWGCWYRVMRTFQKYKTFNGVFPGRICRVCYILNTIYYSSLFDVDIRGFLAGSCSWSIDITLKKTPPQNTRKGKLFTCFKWFFLRFNGNLQAFLCRRTCHRTQRVRQIPTWGIGTHIGRIFRTIDGWVPVGEPDRVFCCQVSLV